MCLPDEENEITGPLRDNHRSRQQKPVYNYLNVKRWTRNENIFELKRLFFPTHLHGGNHWFAIIVDIEMKKLICYDSLRGSGGNVTYMNNTKNWLNDEHRTRYGVDINWEGWTEANAACPKQNNGCDCGVFTMMFIDLYSGGFPVDWFSQKDIAFFRVKIAADVLRGSVAY